MARIQDFAQLVIVVLSIGTVVLALPQNIHRLSSNYIQKVIVLHELALPQRKRLESADQPDYNSIPSVGSNADSFKNWQPSESSPDQQSMLSQPKPVQYVPAALLAELQRSLATANQQSSDVVLAQRPQQATRPGIGINKRHCWDVTDVCCMWSIC